jgi:hypothetical protein
MPINEAATFGHTAIVEYLESRSTLEPPVPASETEETDAEKKTSGSSAAAVASNSDTTNPLSPQ